jgi:hypothetical protein
MSKIQWHPAFCSAMQLELIDYRGVLEFRDEYQLTKGPLRVDLLIIKKRQNVIIDKNMANVSSLIRTYLDVVMEANIETFKEALAMGGTIVQCLKELGYADKWQAEGEAKGKAEMIVNILSHRLKLPSKRLQKKICSIQDIAKLNELADFAWTCVSLDEFATALE